ncbi:MAG: hypothetical protein HY897_13000 [Deltaproteobacteria bacterium]|nr:hypothetical protein [Deltaproteobacteria bacterium]
MKASDKVLWVALFVCAVAGCNGKTRTVESDAGLPGQDAGATPDGSATQDAGAIDPCNGVDCSSHGYCVPDPDDTAAAKGSLFCICAVGYVAEGQTCIPDPNAVVEKDTCEGMDCSGHGKCVASADITNAGDVKEAECRCDEGYHAESLSCVANNPKELCKGVECSGHGYCSVEVLADAVNPNPTPHCICDSGYYAEKLSCLPNDLADPCAGVTCDGHGKCMADTAGADAASPVAVCKCEDGYLPKNLSCVPFNPDDPCRLVDCSGRGKCTVETRSDAVTPEPVPVCLCEDGYHAEKLSCVQNDPNEPCLNVDCSGHGKCTVVLGPNGSVPQCACQQGYHAEKLSCVPDSSDLCANVTCSGHGSCAVLMGEAGSLPACVCNAGYHAEKLDCVQNDPADACKNVTCSGHGYCTVTITEDGSSPTCICNPGYHADGLDCVVDQCGPANCTGCCDANKKCQPGNTMEQCGSGGATCKICGPSDEEVKKNLDKYWHYRNRLKNDFMVMGQGKGRSLPASSITSWEDTNQNGEKVTKRAPTWGDTTMMLGWYIATLASEHHMLSHPEKFKNYRGSQDRAVAIDVVEKELFYALKAVERLDKVAETFFDKDAKDTQGFFVRDDIDTSFMCVINQTSSPNCVTNAKRSPPYNWLWSSQGQEMSQDQLIHLLLGFSFVHELLPEGLTISGMKPREKVVQLAVPMVEWMTSRRPICVPGSGWNCDGGDCYPVGLEPWIHNWFIHNPVRRKLVELGNCADRNAAGINKTINFITDSRINFGDQYVSNAHYNHWYSMADGYNITFSNPDNMAMAMLLASASNGWEKDDKKQTLKALMDLSESKQAGRAYDLYDMKTGWYVFPLILAALHPKEVSELYYLNPSTGEKVYLWDEYKKTLYGEVRKMLWGAPFHGPHNPNVPCFDVEACVAKCQEGGKYKDKGPAEFAYCNVDCINLRNSTPSPCKHPGWSADTRYVRTGYEQAEGLYFCTDVEGKPVTWWEYHGLDYMVLHNVYYIAMPELWK